jgi:hypothetical protein
MKAQQNNDPSFTTVPAYNMTVILVMGGQLPHFDSTKPNNGPFRNINVVGRSFTSMNLMHIFLLFRKCIRRSKQGSGNVESSPSKASIVAIIFADWEGIILGCRFLQTNRILVVVHNALYPCSLSQK